MNAQVNVLKNNIKIYTKNSSVGAVTPSAGSALFMLAKATLIISPLWYISV
jgi:hypothetical protein